MKIARFDNHEEAFGSMPILMRGDIALALLEEKNMFEILHNVIYKRTEEDTSEDEKEEIMQRFFQFLLNLNEHFTHAIISEKEITKKRLPKIKIDKEKKYYEIRSEIATTLFNVDEKNKKILGIGIWIYSQNGKVHISEFSFERISLVDED